MYRTVQDHTFLLKLWIAPLTGLTTTASDRHAFRAVVYDVFEVAAVTCKNHKVREAIDCNCLFLGLALFGESSLENKDSD